MNNKAICIIPARGGSKRIPKKNVLDFFGHPMISYSINAAKASNTFSNIYVSTDDIEIKSIAEEYGAVVPYLRPKELAGDHPGIKDVIQEMIISLRIPKDAYVCCIYATAALLDGKTLENAYKRLLNHPDKNFLVSVARYLNPPQRALCLEDENLKFLSPDYAMTRTQDLKDCVYDVGQFVWGLANAWLKSQNSILTDNAIPYIISREKACDLDTLEDLKELKILFENQRKIQLKESHTSNKV